MNINQNIYASKQYSCLCSNSNNKSQIKNQPVPVYALLQTLEEKHELYMSKKKNQKVYEVVMKAQLLMQQ